MCTAILLIRPEHPWPITLGATRDEKRTRTWNPPARWWPDQYPGIIGGRDAIAGGTWLALESTQQLVAVLLNRLPKSNQELNTASRGVLPLETIKHGTLALTTESAQAFSPFNLLYASLKNCVWCRWDGQTLSKHDLHTGLYLLNSSDINDIASNPRQRRWFPIFSEAMPPGNTDSDLQQDFWGDWPNLMSDPDSPFGDPTALNVKGVHTDPEFGTVCATLLAFAKDGRVRYDFCPAPPNTGLWQRLI